MAKEDIQDAVRERYGRAARAARGGSRGSCCSGECGAEALQPIDPITRDLYEADELAGLPLEVRLASLGCGNPTALAELAPGEIVLDLGSGGGIDVLLSARRVGPCGKAYGVDMTAEMLALARENQRRAGIENAEFLEGTIESVPLPDSSVDVVISNCVINLAGDKDCVLREAFRLLRSGGRFVVADIVLEHELPAPVRRSVALWTGCVAGALVKSDYEQKLRAAGFTDISFETTRTYDRGDVAAMARSVPESDGGPEAVLAHLDALDGAVVSAFIRARRP
jgi:SAM-dependent methyltransferase